MNHAGDHEAGNDEEDVNTDKSTRHRQPGMKRHNQQDRDRSKSLDVKSAAVANRAPIGTSDTFYGIHVTPLAQNPRRSSQTSPRKLARPRSQLGYFAPKCLLNSTSASTRVTGTRSGQLGKQRNASMASMEV